MKEIVKVIIDFITYSSIVYFGIAVLLIFSDIWHSIPDKGQAGKNTQNATKETTRKGPRQYIQDKLKDTTFFFVGLIVLGVILNILRLNPIVQKSIIQGFVRLPGWNFQIPLPPHMDYYVKWSVIWLVLAVAGFMTYAVVKSLRKSELKWNKGGPAVAEKHSSSSQARPPAIDNKHLKSILPLMESSPVAGSTPKTELQKSLNVCLRHIGMLVSTQELEVLEARATFGANIITVSTSSVPGLTLNKLDTKKNEIENYLGWDGLRFERGESTGHVKIIVPHKQRKRILLRDILEMPEYRRIPAKNYPVPIGLTLEGQPVIAELINPITPHFLISGGTGSGKSFLVNCILFAFLNANSPETFNLAIIDPKGSEFVNFTSFPHLISYVDNNFEKQLALVKYMEQEMNRRNTQIFAPEGVKNIIQWNERFPDKALPRILLVVDEYADIVTDKEQRKLFEPIVMKLAAKARSAGIHLALIMQKPNVETINTTLRSNLGCRVALRMTDASSYRTILSDYDGTTLAGKGDMLVEFSDEKYRLQGSCLTTGNENEEEKLILKAVKYWGGLGYKDSKILQEQVVNEAAFAGTEKEEDDLQNPADVSDNDKDYSLKIKKYVAEIAVGDAEEVFLPTTREIAELLAIGKTCVADNIKRLVQENWVMQVGDNPRNIKYKIVVGQDEAYRWLENNCP